MSIIIASLDYDNKIVHIGTDRRQMKMSGESVEEEITKLLEIRPNLYYAINGDVNNGKRLSNLLLESKNLPVSELINLIERFELVKTFAYGVEQGHCVFVLAGIHEDNEPFIYCTFTKESQSYFIRAEKGKIMRAIAAPNNETAAMVSEVFNHALKATNNDHEASIIESIDYASSIDHTISATFDFASAQSPSMILESNQAATGTLIVGNAEGTNNAGITGIVDRGEESVRFYAGSTFTNRNIAPFRVQDNGKVFMLDAVVSGKVEASTGYIGAWAIEDSALAARNKNAYISMYNTGYFVGVGDNVYPATSAPHRATARFDQTTPNTSFGVASNTALALKASGSDHNYALDIQEGDIKVQGEVGKTFTQNIGGGYALKFVKGLYVGTVAAV